MATVRIRKKQRESKEKMANEQNLKPCKPGETHNPAGRPGGQPNRATLVRKLIDLKANTPEDVKKAFGEYWKDIPKAPTYKDLIVYAQIVKAVVNKDTKAAEFLFDSVFGKSQENIGPIKQVLEVVWKGGNGRDDNNTDDNVKLTETDPETG